MLMDKRHSWRWPPKKKNIDAVTYKPASRLALIFFSSLFSSPETRMSLPSFLKTLTCNADWYVFRTSTAFSKVSPRHPNLL